MGDTAMRCIFLSATTKEMHRGKIAGASGGNVRRVDSSLSPERQDSLGTGSPPPKLRKPFQSPPKPSEPLRNPFQM
eukprot:2769837-Pyramimonas_sp.AAC.1